MNRRDRAAFKNARASLRQWAGEDDGSGWTDGEWRRLIERAAAQGTEPIQAERFSALRPLVSAAAALVVLVWAAAFLLKTRPADLSARNAAGPAEIAAPAGEDFRPLPEIVSPEDVGRAESSLSRPAAPLEIRRLLASTVETPRPSENKPAFTWISSETGLKIIWFTNNNLKLEDLP
jgi:hypothetical protein